MLLTGLAWGLAYAHTSAGTFRLTMIFPFVHFLAGSLLVSTATFFFVGRFLGPGIAGLPGRRRQQGLFVQPQERDQLEFGYCFDVSFRFKILIYVWSRGLTTGILIGFDSGVLSSVGVTVRGTVHIDTGDIKRVLGVIILRKYIIPRRSRVLLHNNLSRIQRYASKNFIQLSDLTSTAALPFLHHTNFLLTPLVGCVVLWIITLLGYNLPRHIIPIMIAGRGAPTAVPPT